MSVRISRAEQKRLAASAARGEAALRALEAGQTQLLGLWVPQTPELSARFNQGRCGTVSSETLAVWFPSDVTGQMGACTDRQAFHYDEAGFAAATEGVGRALQVDWKVDEHPGSPVPLSGWIQDVPSREQVEAALELEAECLAALQALDRADPLGYAPEALFTEITRDRGSWEYLPLSTWPHGQLGSAGDQAVTLTARLLERAEQTGTIGQHALCLRYLTLKSSSQMPTDSLETPELTAALERLRHYGLAWQTLRRRNDQNDPQDLGRRVGEALAVQVTRDYRAWTEEKLAELPLSPAAQTQAQAGHAELRWTGTLELAGIPLSGPLDAGRDAARRWLIANLGLEDWEALLAAAQADAQRSLGEWTAPPYGGLRPSVWRQQSRARQLAVTLNPILAELPRDLWTLELAAAPLRRGRTLRDHLLPGHPRALLPSLRDLGARDAAYAARYRALSHHMGPEHASLLAGSAQGSGQLPGGLETEEGVSWTTLLLGAVQAGRRLGDLKVAAELARDCAQLHAATREQARAPSPGLRALLRRSPLGESYGLLRGLRELGGDLTGLHAALIDVARELGAEPRQRRRTRAATRSVERLAGDTLPAELPELAWIILEPAELPAIGAALNNCAGGYRWATRGSSRMVLIGPADEIQQLSCGPLTHLAHISWRGQWRVEQISAQSNAQLPWTAALRSQFETSLAASAQLGRESAAST